MQSQAPYQAATATPALHYVGVGRRFLATLLDGTILSIVDGIISTIFLSGSFTKGATLGKMMIFGNSGCVAKKKLICYSEGKRGPLMSNQNLMVI